MEVWGRKKHGQYFMVIGFSLGTLLRDDEDDELTASLNDCGTTTLDKDMLGLE